MFFKVKCVIPMPLVSTKGTVQTRIRASIAMSDSAVLKKSQNCKI